MNGPVTTFNAELAEIADAVSAMGSIVPKYRSCW
jgi:hypothetical protein